MRASFVLAILIAGCFKPDLGDGVVSCGTNGQCPPKYFCHAADQRCYKTPDPNGADMSASQDLAGAMGDLAGADLQMCTKIACGTRNCGMIPDGCGGVESCGGVCTSPQTCGGGNSATHMPNVCNSGPACSPKQCVADKDCGQVSDDCAAVLDCGTCPTGKSCGTDHMCH